MVPREFLAAKSTRSIDVFVHHEDELEADFEVIFYVLELPEVGREGESAVCDRDDAGGYCERVHERVSLDSWKV